MGPSGFDRWWGRLPRVAGAEQSSDLPDGHGARHEPGDAHQTLLSGAPETAGPALTAPDIRQKAVVGALLVGVRGVAVRVFGLAGNVVLARLLAPEDFGTVALALSLLTFGSLVFDGGLGASLIRRAHEPTVIELRTLLALQILGALTLAGGVAAAGLALGGAGTIAAVMILALPIMALRGPGMVMLERRLSFGPIAAVEVGEVIAYYGWAVVTVALGLGVWGFATASLVKAFVGTVTLLRLAPESLRRPAFSREHVRSLLSLGVRVQAVEVLRAVRDQGLNLATFAIAGAATLGLWALTTRVLQIPLLLFESLWRVSFPTMAQLISAGEDVRPLMERAVAVIGAATGLIATMLVCSTPALIPGVFGPSWTDATAALATACLGLQIHGPISAVTSGYLFASDEAGVVVRSAAAQAVAWGLVSLPLLPLIGVTALGVGYVAVGVVELVILARAARRLAGARLVSPQLVPLVVGVTTSIAGWLIVSEMPATILTALTGASLGAGLYLAGLVVMRRALVVELAALGRRAMSKATAGT